MFDLPQIRVDRTELLFELDQEARVPSIPFIAVFSSYATAERIKNLTDTGAQQFDGQQGGMQLFEYVGLHDCGMDNHWQLTTDKRTLNFQLM